MDNVWLAIVVAVLGVAALGITVRIVHRRKTIRTTVQRNNIVGGDQAGGDIIKK
jgi:heme exporter protein D